MTCYGCYDLMSICSRSKVEYADLAIIDISKAFTPEGAELVVSVREAMTKLFFSTSSTMDMIDLKSVPLLPELIYLECSQAARITDISDVLFARVSQEEKKMYEGTMKTTGSYQGYKLRNYWVCLMLRTR